MVGGVVVVGGLVVVVVVEPLLERRVRRAGRRVVRRRIGGLCGQVERRRIHHHLALVDVHIGAAAPFAPDHDEVAVGVHGDVGRRRVEVGGESGVEAEVNAVMSIYPLLIRVLALTRNSDEVAAPLAEKVRA